MFKDKNKIIELLTDGEIDLSELTTEYHTVENILAAMKWDRNAVKYASHELRENIDFMLPVVTYNGMLLQYASPALQNNKEFVLAAVANDGAALKYANFELQKDLEIILTALRANKSGTLSLDDSLRDRPEISFINAHRFEISDQSWPVVKKALLEQPDHFLNPNPALQSIIKGMANPYLYTAIYALNKETIEKYEPYDELQYLGV